MDGVVAILASLPNGTDVAGLVILLGVMLATGMIATRRELNDKNKQIEVLTEANKEDRETIREALSGQRTIIQLLEGMQGGGDSE